MKHRRSFAPLVVVGLAVPAALVFACSTNEDTKTFPHSSSGTNSGGSGTGGGTGGEPLFDGGIENPLKVTPENPVMKLQLPLAGQTIQFQCIDQLTQLPAAATWSLSNLDLGAIDANGIFTPNGKSTGEVTVKCEAGDAKAQTTLKVIIHAVDNQGGLTQQQIDVLKGPPGATDPAWQFLYPYDNTVFPRGILAPEIQLTSGSAAGTAFYVHIIAPDYEYEGFFNTGAVNTQLKMAELAWEALTNSAGGTKVDVHVSKLVNGQKYGPIFRRWVLANGKLHGTVYYNSYDSPLAGNGAILRIKGSSPTPEVLLGNCTVCHSIAADGSTAAAAAGTFDLTGGMLNPPMVGQSNDGSTAFAGLFPKNGDVFVTNGAPGWGNTPGTGGTYTSQLRTKQGTVIPQSGIEGFYAQTPVFSHDGLKLAFYDRSPGQQSSPGVLAIMDYDPITQKFSNYQVLATPPPNRHYSWPAFTPDGKQVVYQDGVGDDLATWSGNTAKMFAVDVQTKQLTFLANLNGDGYVPQGARDENKNYEPTIAPIASGGYFWVMFTSRRTWGNKLTGSEGETKRLWVSALEINAQGGIDFSHPAFYVPGQELTSGNSRGFWALDPCKQDGQTCETGDECCNGFCNPTGDPPMFLCGPPDGRCADEFETCETSADCCNPEHECIGGKCTQLPPE